MASRYKEYKGLHLPAIEQEMLAAWDKNHAFEKSIELREGATPFVFYEGPPSANGLPGIHHVISRTLKDLVCRYKTMKGYQVKRKGGWDTHGLPIELGVEKELGITKEDIGKKISVEEYNQKCREAVMRYKDKWDDVTRKMGYWVDLKDPYITFKNDYIETLWWILSELYKKDLLYESVSIQPYSPAAGTGLSSHELNQPGTYKMVKDTSIVAMFKAVKNEKSKFLFDAAGDDQVFFMAWTTTPWTLPSNLGLTVGGNIDYILVKTFNPYTHLPVNVILAKALLQKYFKEEGRAGDFNAYKENEKIIPWKILAEFKGKQLEGCKYEQLLPYDANTIEKIQEITPGAKPFRVMVDTFVTTEDGTGIVHTAPAFGADDYKAGKKNNIGILTLVDKQGKFIDGVGEFSNRYVKNYKDQKDYVDVNVDISVKLKLENRAFKIEKYEHNYPHCWRTDKPILYYPLEAWFIKTTAVKDRMVELNKTINWKPKSTGEGRFGNWLENMVDWNLSRSRFWGTPLPIWKTSDGNEEKCIGSVAELNAEIRKATEQLGGDINKNYFHDGILDLHKPYVDEIILVSKDGKPMKRVSDLIDVWFDSGAMPYAQWHFPFENKETFKQNFPADFIAEGVDQTRGWFYTLHAIAVMLFDSVAYKTCVSNGLVLDKNGNKMSKRVGNVVDPFSTIEQFGADATRWYLITNASPWDNLKFDPDGIKEIQRKFFGTLYNTYQFFTLYANVDGFAFKEKYVPLAERPEIDRWILSSLNTLIKKVTESFDDYEPTAAGRLIEDFVDEQLSNWYVRLCRRRFWKGEYEADKISAYQTLYECLETILRLMAPVSPFFSDAIFQNLDAVTNRYKLESVHHADFPVSNEQVIDLLLEERMQMAQDVSSLVLSLRKKINIKVRQPLQKILVPVLSAGMKQQFEKIEDLVKSEVNVKEVSYLEEDTGFISKKIKPNYVALGKKLGPKMKAVAAALANFTQEDIAKLEKEGSYSLPIENEPVILQVTDVDISSEDIPGWMVANKGNLTVALDVTVTPDLIEEGNAREIVNRIQKIRKDNGFELTDRILVQLTQHKELVASVNKYNSYICAEILADKLEFVPEISDGTEIEVNDIPLKVFVTKKSIMSMAVKKKAVKAAKKAPAKPAPHKTGKPVPVKKPVAKKPAPKPVPAPKKAVKPAAKPAPVKEPVSAAKSATKPVTAKKLIPPPSVKSVIKPKSEPVPVKKPEIKKPEPVSALPNKPYVPPKPTFKPVTNTPPPIPKKQAGTDKPAKVAMPEIKTKTVRKYQPDFTKSVLDQPSEQSSGPTMRYSDAELLEFRDIITKKLDAAKKELTYLQGLITRKDEMGGDNDDGRYMTMEDGGMSMEREQLSQMASRQISFIDHLEKAMMRIENKTYGICRVTGKLIDKARLRAVPHATLSIEAKQMMNK